MIWIKQFCKQGHNLAETRKRKPSGQTYCFEYNRKRTDLNRLARPVEWARYQKKANLKRYYGISPEIYDDLYSKQNGVCAICFKSSGNRALAVDHDHVSGRVRGLLCGRCNTGLGNFLDNKTFLAQAIEYLK